MNRNDPQWRIVQALLAGNPIPQSVPLQMRAPVESAMNAAYLSDSISRQNADSAILSGELSKPQFRGSAEENLTNDRMNYLSAAYPRRPVDKMKRSEMPNFMTREEFFRQQSAPLQVGAGQDMVRGQAGSDYLTGPDVGAITKAVEAAGPAGDAQKTKQALMSLMEALDDYERQYREGGGGAVFDQQQKDLLQQRRGVVQMIAKDVFGMGAPQAAEFEMLDQTLGVDPTGIIPNVLDAIDDWTGGLIGSDLDGRFYSGVEAARDMMTDIAAPKLREYRLSAEEIAKIRRNPDEMSDDDYLKALGLQ